VGTILDLRVTHASSHDRRHGAFESAFGGVATPHRRRRRLMTPTPTKTPTPTRARLRRRLPTPIRVQHRPGPRPRLRARTPKPTASPTPSGVAHAAAVRSATTTMGTASPTLPVYRRHRELASHHVDFRSGRAGRIRRSGLIPSGAFTAAATPELGLYEVATGIFFDSRGEEHATSVVPFVAAEWLPAQATTTVTGDRRRGLQQDHGRSGRNRVQRRCARRKRPGAQASSLSPQTFDGDGKADVAVYQIGTGAWTYIASSTGCRSASHVRRRWKIRTGARRLRRRRQSRSGALPKRKGKWRLQARRRRERRPTSPGSRTGWLATPGDFDGDARWTPGRTGSPPAAGVTTARRPA